MPAAGPGFHRPTSDFAWTLSCSQHSQCAKGGTLGSGHTEEEAYLLLPWLVYNGVGVWYYICGFVCGCTKGSPTSNSMTGPKKLSLVAYQCQFK